MSVIEMLKQIMSGLEASSQEGTDKPEELQDYFDKLDNFLTIHARAKSWSSTRSHAIARYCGIDW